MKKTFMSSVFALLALFVLGGGTVFAQNQAVLPNAGLTPESPFYFLDKFGEALREFFTFNPDGKARLQITFAAERVAEIKVIIEKKGVEAKGLEVAQNRLEAHLASAAAIVTDQKAKGKDVSQLAKELDDEFEGPKTALEQSFKEQERALEAQEKESKRKIIEARRVGDTAQVESLVQQFGQVKAQKELLELKEEEVEEALEKEEERLEEEMEARVEAEKAIREAEKEKKEVLDEAAEENIIVPAEAFGKFNSSLAEAKSALTAGNFPEARRLAKQAEKSLNAVEDAIEDLEEAEDEAEELKEEQEEKEQEAKEEREEKVKEEAKKEAERLEIKDGNKDSESVSRIYDWSVEFILCKECSPYKLDVFTEQELLLFKDELLAQLPDEEVAFEKLRTQVLNGFFINMTDLAFKSFNASNINLSGAKISTLYYKPILGQQKTPINENEIYACSEDRECISVKAEQCGCNEGGRATTINKRYFDYWEKQTSKSGVLCLHVISNHPTCFMKPKCVQNKCKLQ